ncbi:flavin reductase family protein [Amycolatopsis sp. CA-230715]|uniref:flavin reductase family protein n=1 Tax=Amycolatopsis sp. CA-230715 TaxID=2745196 RepID=UPI001C039D80|nr:flavin reductase family protein [Amycolatopsis sp. CA-230715]QWF85976.1 Flavin reductase (NADPH) [Amycolatopsis sp. CA-230715]
MTSPQRDDAFAVGEATVEPSRFRALMSTFPTGVAIVTASEPDGTPWGMTCSSVCSVTVEPATMLVCLRTGSPTLRAVLDASAFAVNLLHRGSRATAELFASGLPDRFDRVRWLADPAFGGPHLVSDAHAIADCRVASTVAAGDHVVVLGRVYQVDDRVPDGQPPLLYGFRGYSSWHAVER